MSLPVRSVRLPPDRYAESASDLVLLLPYGRGVRPRPRPYALEPDRCGCIGMPFAPDTHFGGSLMSAAAMIRTCVVHGVVLLLASRALAQTDAANPPAPPAAAVVAASQSPPKSPPPLAPDGFFQEPRVLPTSIDSMIDKVGGDGEPNSGFYPESSNMITGSGWLSVGPGYRQFLFDRELLIDGSA